MLVGPPLRRRYDWKVGLICSPVYAENSRRVVANYGANGGFEAH